MERIVPLKRKVDDNLNWCICGLDFENGSFLTCEVCSYRAHAACFGIVDVHILDKWKCHRCDPITIRPMHERTWRNDQSAIQTPQTFPLPKRRRPLFVDEQGSDTRTSVPVISHISRDVDGRSSSPEHGSGGGGYIPGNTETAPNTKISLRVQRTDGIHVGDNKRESLYSSLAGHVPRGEARLRDTSTPISRPLEYGGQMDNEAFTRASLDRPSDRDGLHAQGFFTNSHHLVLNNPIMYDIKNTKEPVLRWLTDSGFLMRGAEFDSDLRDPPPRCHPGTRLDLLQTITQRLDSLEHGRRSLWIKGPVAVGKTAIVQTLAEKVWLEKKLGASLFFSRPNGRTNSSFVFPTIAYQLAVRIPYYREYLERKMVENPKMLEKTMKHQFSMLIAEPFYAMRESHPGPLAVLIDGLDECGDQEAQISIVTLISEFTLQCPKSPLIWVLASRPESHLAVTFRSEGISQAFWTLEVPVDSDQACQDVERFLRAKFREISEKYPDDIPPGAQWPIEHDMMTICKASSGHFGFAATLARFIGDGNTSDPIHQLTIVLHIAKHPHVDPLASLHSLYLAIFDRVPKHLLPPLKLLLSFRLSLDENVSNPGIEAILFPLVSTATIFNLEQHTVYAALRKLHSVIKVPSIESSGKDNIHFYHASFADFLCDKSKSGDYALDAREYYTELWQCCFMFASTYFSDSGPIQPVRLAWDVASQKACSDGSVIKIAPILYERAVYTLIHYLMPGKSQCCKALPHVQMPLTQFQNALETIDFSRIPCVQNVMVISAFVNFHNWLLNEAPEAMRSLKFITQVGLKDFDLSRIISTKPTVRIYGRPSGFQARSYSDNSNSLVDMTGSSDSVEPVARVVHFLEDLRKSNPELKAVILGKGPSKSAAIICYDKPANGPLHGGLMLYYIPYDHEKY